MVRDNGKGMKTALNKVAFSCFVYKASRLDTIQCNKCSMWVHRECVKMSPNQMTEYTNNPYYFLCPRCVSFADGEVFDFSQSLARLALTMAYKLINLIINYGAGGVFIVTLFSWHSDLC